jgi:uncharacterized protein YegL
MYPQLIKITIEVIVVTIVEMIITILEAYHREKDPVPNPYVKIPLPMTKEHFSHFTIEGNYIPKAAIEIQTDIKEFFDGESQYALDDLILVKQKIKNHNNGIFLTMAMEKNAMPNGKAGETYMVTTLQISLPVTQRPYVDLICVIDRSGSMSGEKMKLVKEALLTLLEYLDEQDRLSLIVFNQDSSILSPLQSITAENKENLRKQIEKVVTGGGTNISAAMDDALKILKERKHTKNVTSIFLLSDGADNHENCFERVKKSIKDRKMTFPFTINSFGIGAENDSILMKNITQLQYGDYSFISDKKLNSIDEGFIKALGGLMSVTAHDAEVKIRANPEFPGVELIDPCPPEETIWKVEGEYLVTRASQLTNTKNNYLLGVKFPRKLPELPANKEKILIALADVALTDAKGNYLTHNAKLKVPLFDNPTDFEETESNPTVSNHVYRIKGAKLLLEAKHLCDKKLFGQAQKLILEFIGELEKGNIFGQKLIDNLIEDMKEALNNMDSSNYQSTGKHELVANARAQFREKSYKSDSLSKTQQDMLKSLPLRKEQIKGSVLIRKQAKNK